MYQRKKSKWRKRKRPQQPMHRYAAFIKKLKEEQQLDILATTYWETATPVLKNMQVEITNLGKPPGNNQVKETISYCISLLDIISRYQDILDGSLKIAPGEKSDAADSFNKNMSYAGRHTEQETYPDDYYGDLLYWNTTSKGETVTADNIYFGPELGLPRKPASYWLSLSKKKKVTVNAVLEFKNVKGQLARPRDMWATEGLVKVVINDFIRNTYYSFLTDIDALLA